MNKIPENPLKGLCDGKRIKIQTSLIHRFPARPHYVWRKCFISGRILKLLFLNWRRRMDSQQLKLIPNFEHQIHHQDLVYIALIKSRKGATYEQWKRNDQHKSEKEDTQKPKSQPSEQKFQRFISNFGRYFDT